LLRQVAQSRSEDESSRNTAIHAIAQIGAAPDDFIWLRDTYGRVSSGPMRVTILRAISTIPSTSEICTFLASIYRFGDNETRAIARKKLVEGQEAAVPAVIALLRSGAMTDFKLAEFVLAVVDSKSLLLALPTLLAELEYEPGKLGVDLEESLGGMRFVMVAPDSAAESSGIRVGDALLALDGIPIGDTPREELITRIRGVPGTQVELRILPASKAEERSLVLTRKATPDPLARQIISAHIARACLSNRAEAESALRGLASDPRPAIPRQAARVQDWLRGHPASASNGD
ncbi:MAG: PDZ domain-containing protein, partial [Elusimicrobia bacterium]|nr:PDZ domain-containing protein [Elusimicrobiota bacterium]